MNRRLAAAAIAVTFCVPAAAQSAAPLVVSQEWLASHLHDTDLGLLQVGTDGSFEDWARRNLPIENPGGGQ